MNIYECDVLTCLKQHGRINQREISSKIGYSLGGVNKSVKSLIQAGYLDNATNVTELAKKQFDKSQPKRAIILAAGFGMRMVPIGTTVPKALLEVKGEILIERTIRQLHEVGIKDIQIIVGFMKEEFEYLIDKYHVQLIVNEKYATTNNLISLCHAVDVIENTYIIPADIWMRHNPYCRDELYSWYLVSEELTEDSDVRCNRKKELVKTISGQLGNRMIGIAYITAQDAAFFRKRIVELCQDNNNDQVFWEEALYNQNKMMVHARMCSESDFTEFNTFENLREFDSQSEQLKSPVLTVIARVFDTETSDIRDISVLKKGMTNRSFLFSVMEKRYIMRIPGEGTDKMINRKQEAAVYQAINKYQLSDSVFYMDSKTGYKISEFLENARTCNPQDKQDVFHCMQKLRQFHNMTLVVDHEFDLFGEIEFYERLRGQSIFKDYTQTKSNVFKLKSYVDKHKNEFTLCHIDAIPDNFLFVENEIYLIDWEYAGMQDPHIDIAMFAIYSLYNRDQVDSLIDMYFEKECPKEIRVKIYCYVALCGLLWSNWCEYKAMLGIEFGEYSLRQYRYAKEFYKIAIQLMEYEEGQYGED